MPGWEQNQRGHPQPRRITTGQSAWATQCRLTEPISTPTNSPCPRFPTTRSEAPFEASTRAGAGCRSITTLRTSTGGVAPTASSIAESRRQRASSSGLKSAGRGPSNSGYSHAVTAATAEAVSWAWRTAHRKALFDDGEPSTPTTIFCWLPSPGSVTYLSYLCHRLLPLSSALRVTGLCRRWIGRRSGRAPAEDQAARRHRGQNGDHRAVARGGRGQPKRGEAPPGPPRGYIDPRV